MDREKVRENILAYADLQIGIKEEPPGSNIVKYNDWYYDDNSPYWRNPKPYAWCGCFVSMCYKEGGFGMPKIDTELGVHYVPTLFKMAKANKWVTTEPKQGDLVLFDWQDDGNTDHIGIFVEWIEKGRSFWSIEGNTSPDEHGDQSNGGMVCKKKRYKKNVSMFVNLIDNIE